jgi:hypothetical protein
MPPEKLIQVEAKAKQLFSDTQPMRDTIAEQAKDERTPKSPMQVNTELTAATATGVELLIYQMSQLIAWRKEVDATLHSHSQYVQFGEFTIKWILAPLSAIAFTIFGALLSSVWPTLAAYIKGIL